jgi:hypothetical protein
MVEFEEIEEKNENDLIKEINKLKDIGNKLFKEKDYFNAEKIYREALLKLENTLILVDSDYDSINNNVSSSFNEVDNIECNNNENISNHEKSLINDEFYENKENNEIEKNNENKEIEENKENKIENKEIENENKGEIENENKEIEKENEETKVEVFEDEEIKKIIKYKYKIENEEQKKTIIILLSNISACLLSLVYLILKKRNLSIYA